MMSKIRHDKIRTEKYKLFQTLERLNLCHVQFVWRDVDEDIGFVNVWIVNA